MTASIVVNGKPAPLAAATLHELLARLGYDAARPGIAVARNGRVVPRSRWRDEPVGDGDEIEVVTAVQGG
jgi:sulfur carrier protein